MSGGGNDGSNIYQYGNSGAADQGAIGGATTLQNSSQLTQGLYGNALGGLGGLTNGTNYNAQSGVNAGNAEQQAVSGLPGAANNALQAGSNANAGLYAQQLQQTNDQTNAALAQRGVANTPYGAAVQSDADRNFNNNWNTQQVGLQNTAANTASTLLGSYNSGMTGGAATSQAAANNPLQALGSLLQSGNLSTSQMQSAISDYLAYLSGGTGASSAQATAANQSQAMQNQSLAGLGQLAGTAFGAFF